jgi:hypothetical protein
MVAAQGLVTSAAGLDHNGYYDDLGVAYRNNRVARIAAGEVARWWMEVELRQAW